MTQPALAFNKRGSGRHYRHPVTGVEVPSVTNIIGVLDKPAIPRWAAKKVAEQAWKLRASLAEMGEDECVDVLKGSPWRQSGRAADRGTSVHDYLEAAAEGRDVELSGEALTYKAGADQFLKQYRPQFVHTEFTVFGDAGYAGTGDAIAYIGGDLAVVDYKTNAKGQVYPEVALQLAGLRFADEIVLPDGTVESMPAVDRCLAVSITPTGCRVVEVDAGREAFEAFLACLRAWRWRNGGNPVGEVVPAQA